MKSTSKNTTATPRGVRIKSRVKAGEGGEKLASNHNQAAKGLRIKSRVRAGSGADIHFTTTVSKASSNHNQALRGLRVKSGLKAGLSLNFTKIAF